ncbi:MAG: glycosyltransferase family 4 protein [Mollicutes bacterium]|nr:glycosyltransferase family 4 protein [Mollicutes bacterium]
MKKVLIIINSLGGLYSFRRELIERLIREGFSIVISAPNNERARFFIDLGCKYIETYVEGRSTNPVIDFKLFLKYMSIIKEEKPDIVLTYTIKPNVYGGLACRILGIPHMANITGLGTAVENEGILQKITLSLYKIGLKKSKVVFFQNSENMEFMQSNNLGKENGILIPGSGVNLNHYSLLEYPNEEEVNFLFIGRVMKEKGIDQYIKSAEEISKRYPNTRFHVIGSCEESYLEKLNKHQENGVLIYHGRQEDVREFHKISHCTIHPTYYPEGMSNVLLESAASGRPIITTNRSGCREIVDDGINGYIVEQQNSEDLVEKIEKFIKLSYEDKKEMGLAGRRKVEEKFDRRIVVDVYLDEINKIFC